MNTALLLNANSEKSQAFLKGLDSRLATVIEETCGHRRLVRQVKQEAFRAPIPPVSSASTSTSGPIPSTSSSSLIPPNSSASASASASKYSSASTPTSITRGKQVKKKTKAVKKGADSTLSRKARNEAAKQARIKAEREAEQDNQGDAACRRCKNEKMEDRCIRLLKVNERPDTASLVGAALTCAPEGDRLQPLPPVSLFLFL